jgi:hypothetical protein
MTLALRPLVDRVVAPTAGALAAALPWLRRAA